MHTAVFAQNFYCFINYTGVWERLKMESGEVIEIS